MANLRAIRTRIKSVESTRQITKSMKMVAASKLRKTQGAFASLGKFAELSGELLAEAGKGAGEETRALFAPDRGDPRRTCLVLMVGNRGLCGTYNHTLLRYCENLARERTQSAPGKEKTDPAEEPGTPDAGEKVLPPELSLLVCGRWGRDLIAATGLPVLETLELSDNPSREEALQLTERLKRMYLAGEADEVVLVYQQYRSVLSQTPGSRVLLPLAPPEDAAAADHAEELIFEPDRERVLEVLLDLYLVNTVHAAMLEARTGEHSARMTAMTAAADNTEELISELTLKLNHARQAAITTEITEIASGAEALRNAQSGGTI